MCPTVIPGPGLPVGLPQDLPFDELKHLLKNTLATVQSLARLSAHGASSIETFMHAFTLRLIALSKAYDQLTVQQWENAHLNDILSAIAAPYTTGGEGQFVCTGDNVALAPRAALTLAMAFHELATNAAKYGALSVPTGRVTVRWEITREHSSSPNQLCIEWHEQGGPKVTPPSRRGFGTKFIETSVPFELGGTVRIFFDETGVRCAMRLEGQTTPKTVFYNSPPESLRPLEA
jgi:two-component sensor histidine kinase